MYKIPQHQALLIRTLTDPLNSTYIASRLAQLHGLRVIDDPESILICCDKVNMDRHLLRNGVPVPETVFLQKSDLAAASAIGNGLYGVDLKQVGAAFLVIEVNDNPTIAEGEEDQKAPRVYERLIRYLAREWG
jgi:glutathione synthase/RimK-type ligase-like ATP-grasp enzyme